MSQETPLPDLESLRRDYHVLDTPLAVPAGIRLVCDQSVGVHSPESLQVEQIKPRGIAAAFARIPFFGRFLFALQMLRSADLHTVIMCFGGSWLEKYLGILNYYLPVRRRKLLLIGPFIQTESPLKRRYARRMVFGATLSVTWSALSRTRMAEYLDIPEEKIIHVPYKSNHSQSTPIRLPIGNYVFSGGNGCRDYRTLIEAVRGTAIPTIISTTDPRTIEGIDVPENVIVLAAREPSFARLMAASRVVVFPIDKRAVRGGAAANILNAMWHYKPVIAAEDPQAREYIDEGRTGYCVPAGDVLLLRERLIQTWNASPKHLFEMGHAAHESVAANFTHEIFIRRICRLAAIIAAT
jgi:glycosyltransferase involved in cell wall biosynthesis